MKNGMNKHEVFALELLRSLFWNEPVTCSEDFDDWNPLVAFSKRQSVLGFIAKSILSNNEINPRISAEVRLKLKSFLVSNVMTYDKMTGVLIKVSKALSESEISHVLLKGHGLAVNYPYPQLRQCGDIDLYVGKENSLATYRTLAGVVDRIATESEALWGKHYDAFVGDIQIEVHRHTSSHDTRKFAEIYSEIAQKGLNEDLKPVSFDGVEVMTPSVTFNAYYVFDHLFEHFLTSGIGLRHLCDLMMFLHVHKDTIDKDYLKILLDRMEMLEPWQVFGDILVKYLGLPNDEFPFYVESTKTDKVLKYILFDGNFGKSTVYYTRRSDNYLLTKLNAFWCHLTRGAKMMRLFPSQEIRHFRHVVQNYFLHLRKDLKRKLIHGR